MVSPTVFASALFASSVNSQQFPPPSTYTTVLQSPANPNITISYKTPSNGTCATAFGHQRQYSGYVSLPPYTLAQQNYSVNTFFWFFEARANPEVAPLTIWLSGGPGSSSMVGLFQEMGPCEIFQLPNGSYSTRPRLWGWDRSSNLLFIDQPTQTGFSYDERVDAAIDLSEDYPYALESRMAPAPLTPGTPPWRNMNGTFASGKPIHTQRSTALTARACWHFLQGFLSAFPQYNPGTRPNRTTVEPSGVNLFTESYGGIYGPSFADLFEEQNDRRSSGVLPNSTLEIQLDSVAIINGIVDIFNGMISIANFTRNNTYGISAIDLLTYQNAIFTLNSDAGCRDLVTQCRRRTKGFDSEGVGVDDDTNRLCAMALDACNKVAGGLYDQVQRSPYDIRHRPEVGLGAAYAEYLNSADVMQSIGAQVNYTESSVAVLQAFAEIGDAVRGTQLQSLAELLARGIRVAFIYGDADVICNWYSGQNASLSLASLVPSYSTAFPSAGYADIVVNDTYIGGHVRQFGNLSFSRIFDAGHFVPFYQPETAFTVFSRIVQGDDISLGHNVNLSTFKTDGISDSAVHKNVIPPEIVPTCWIRDVAGTCTEEQRTAIGRGEGAVSNGVWSPDAVARPEAPPLRLSTKSKTSVSSVMPTTTVPLTGVFTATAIPTPASTSTAKSGACRKTIFGAQKWDGKALGWMLSRVGMLTCSLMFTLY